MRTEDKRWVKREIILGTDRKVHLKKVEEKLIHLAKINNSASI